MRGHKAADLACAAHLNTLLEPVKLAKRIRQCKAALKKYDYDAIAVRGVSGLLLGPTLAMKCRKSLIVVRKPDEDCHSSNVCEGDRGTKRYVIVDDFVDTGSTVTAIMRAVKEWQVKKHGIAGECIGVLEATCGISSDMKLADCERVHLNTDHNEESLEEEEE